MVRTDGHKETGTSSDNDQDVVAVAASIMNKEFGIDPKKWMELEKNDGEGKEAPPMQPV